MVENLQKLSVLHCVPSLRTQDGGPSRTVVALCDAMASLPRIDVSLVYQRNELDTNVICRNPLVRMIPARAKSVFSRTLGFPMRTALQSCRVEARDIIHVHALWHAASHWAANAASRAGKTLVLQPRGMLEPYALARRPIKKRLALALYQRRDLRESRMLIATSELEFEGFRQLGCKQPVAIIPNGVSLPALREINAGRAFRRPGPRRALFLSRIHPKKGVLELVDAWARCRPAGWTLDIAGPDEKGHSMAVLRAIRVCGLVGQVRLLGEVGGDTKAELLASAELFILPSYSENFGMVIAEALASGLPVITTRAAPWKELLDHRCGWWIPMSKENLDNAILEATSLTTETLIAMGDRGRALAEKYRWNTAAEKTFQAYQWINGSGDKPGWVVTDL